MDYSFLLVVETLLPGSDTDIKNGRNKYVNKNQVYHLGIIDYLQEWNLAKKTEKLLKTLISCKSNLNISSVPPEKYEERFLKFMKTHVFNQKLSRQSTF